MPYTCPACETINTSAKEYIFSSTRGENKRWLKCKNCNAYFIIEDYEKTKEVSHAHTTSYGTVKNGLELTAIKQKLYSTILNLAKHFEVKHTNSKWLDIGCSFGGLIEQVKTNGYIEKGMDILPEAIDFLASKGYNVQLSSSVNALDKNEAFDVVSVIDCHYYWPNQNTELGLIKERLNPNGLLILKTSNKSWLVSLGVITRRFIKPFGNKMIARALNDHRFSIPLSSLIKLLKQHGYKVETVNIRDAYFSYHSSFIVKAGFLIGSLIYSLTGIMIAPGALIVARKSDYGHEKS